MFKISLIVALLTTAAAAAAGLDTTSTTVDDDGKKISPQPPELRVHGHDDVEERSGRQLRYKPSSSQKQNEEKIWTSIYSDADSSAATTTTPDDNNNKVITTIYHKKTKPYSTTYKKYGNSSPYSIKTSRTYAIPILPDRGSMTLTPYAQRAPYGGGGSGSAVPLRQERLANVEFYNDLDSINPRNNNSLWQWVGTDLGYQADRAAFVQRSGGGGGGGYYNKYQKNVKPHVDIVSIPFSQYLSPNETNSDLTYYEGAIELIATIPVSNMQRLLVRFLFGCKTFNADDFPGPITLSKNPWDDLRLASCYVQIAATDTSGINFACLATNEGVWAAYFRTAAPVGVATFSAFRRIGNRRTQKDLVDCAIQYDRRLNEVAYFLNGYRVWTISPVGMFPARDGITAISVGNGTAQTATPTVFSLSLGTASWLDRPDPNNPTSTQALVRLVDADDYYPDALTFYDPLGLPQNKNYGQGAILSAYKLLLIRAESLPPIIAPAPPVLPTQPYAYQPSSSSLFGRSSPQNFTKV